MNLCGKMPVNRESRYVPKWNVCSFVWSGRAAKLLEHDHCHYHSEKGKSREPGEEFPNHLAFGEDRVRSAWVVLRMCKVQSALTLRRL